jgi:hypothetical protein
VIRETADAILAALVLPNLVVFDTTVPASPAFPYVVVFTGSPRGEDSDRASGQSSTADHEFQTTVVGTNADQVRLLLGWVRAALLDVRLEVAGRLSTGVRPISSTDPRPDDDIPSKPIYASTVWGFYSVPA